MESKLHSIKSELEIQSKEQQKIFDISASRNKVYIDISTKFDEHLKDTMTVLQKVKNEVNG